MQRRPPEPREGQYGRIEGQLSALIWRTQRVRLHTEQGPRPLDRGLYSILGRLHDFGPLRSGALASDLHLDPSTVSRHVRVVAGDGFVDVVRDPDDGRATLLTLTRGGREHLEQRMRANRDALRAATATFEPAERAELVRLLHKLADALGQKETS